MKSTNYHFDNTGKIIIPNRPGFFMRWFSVPTRAYMGAIFALLTFILCLVTIILLNASEFREQIPTTESDKGTLGISSILFITAMIISLIISIGTFILQRQQSAAQLTPYILQRYEQRDVPDPQEFLNNTFESTLPRTSPRQVDQGHVNAGYVPGPIQPVPESTNELQNRGYVGLDG